MEICEHETSNILMVGDMNAHVGNDDEGIAGNNDKIGTNGRDRNIEGSGRKEILYYVTTQQNVKGNGQEWMESLDQF